MRRLFLRYVGILILMVFNYWSVFAQSDSLLYRAESELNKTFKNISNLSAFNREQSAIDLMEKFISAISIDGSFEYPFDSLKKIGKIYSPDHRLRIYSWNIPVGVDQNLYYSVIQYFAKQDKKYNILLLKDTNNFTAPITTQNWPGALYYEIVETKHAGQKYYTLLGFDLGSMLTNKKVIDVITIDEFDILYFCRSLIKYEGKTTDRLVFEFNEHVNMTLKFNQSVNMIVFDHLSPEKPSFEGNYTYYGPDFTHDGLKFEKGIWVHYKNIDITN